MGKDVNLIKSKDVVEESLFLDLIQFEDRPVISAIIKTIAQQKKKLYDAAVSLAEGFLLDIAEGIQLDLIGEELGVPRLGQDDVTYRIFLQISAYKSKSVGTRPEIINIVSRIVGGDVSEILTYSGINKSVDISLFLACYDSLTTLNELLEAFPLVTSHRIVERYGKALMFNSEFKKASVKPGAGFSSVFDNMVSIGEVGGSRLGGLLSASDSFENKFFYTGISDRYNPTYASFSLNEKTSRNFLNGFVKLRRSSDDSELIVMSKDNNLDTQAIYDFNDGSELFVQEWYNQKGTLNFQEVNTIKQPFYEVIDNSITLRNIQDVISIPNTGLDTETSIVINTKYGSVKASYSNDGQIHLPPLFKITNYTVLNRDLKLGEYNSYLRLSQTESKFFIGVTETSQLNINISSGREDGPHTRYFYSRDGQNYNDTLSSVIDLTAQGLTSPFEVVLSNEITEDAQVGSVDISGNNLIGYFPDIKNMVGLTSLNLSNNKISGAIPSLEKLTNLFSLQLNNNNISLYKSSNSQLQPIPITVGYIDLENNNLTQSSVDSLLEDLVVAGRTSSEGVCIVNLGGTGNNSPSASGLTAKDTLVNRGWTVITN